MTDKQREQWNDFVDGLCGVNKAAAGYIRNLHAALDAYAEKTPADEIERLQATQAHLLVEVADLRLAATAKQQQLSLVIGDRERLTAEVERLRAALLSAECDREDVETDLEAAQVAAARKVIHYVEIFRDLFNSSSHSTEEGINYTRWADNPDPCYTMAGIMHTLDALAALDEPEVNA
jgi:hypothetical protein